MRQSSNKLSRYLVPHLFTTQYQSFAWFLESGIRDELIWRSPLEINIRPSLLGIPDEQSIKNTTAHKLAIFKQGSRLNPKEFIKNDTREGLFLFLSPSKYYNIEGPRLNLEVIRYLESTYSIRIYTYAYVQYFGDICKRFCRDGGGKFCLCEIPLMTNSATFFVSGLERVVVHQLVRSAGVYFTYDIKKNVKIATIVPRRGCIIKFERGDKFYVRIQSKKASLYSFLLSFDISIVDLKRHNLYKEIKFHYAEDISDAHSSAVGGIADIFFTVNPRLSPNLRPVRGPDLRQRAGDFMLFKFANSSFYSMFFDRKRYDLGVIGRYRLNKKLSLNLHANMRLLTPEDVLATLKRLINNKKRDEIDHFGNRRLRSVGELLQMQLTVGLERLTRINRKKISKVTGYEKLIHLTEKQARYVPKLQLPLSSFVNKKPITLAMQEFFASNPLSYFMDQINPLSELITKRRLTCRGPGGLSKRTGLPVRNVHYSQYGKMCPFETTDGMNAGLTGSLAIYARTNGFGFIQAPYYKVKNGFVLNFSYPIYLTGLEERSKYISFGDLPIDPFGRIDTKESYARYNGCMVVIPNYKLQYIYISCIQDLSFGIALIPFLEHDDATRTIMGSHMQGQALPLLYPQAPFIGTGLESEIARDSGRTLTSACSGKVIEVNSCRIIVEDKNQKKFLYTLKKYRGSHQGTCITERPLVSLYQKVRAGQILADGSSTEGGELAIGQNLLVAYAAWSGYNFEDGIVISDRLVYDDVFSSLHIKEFECTIRTEHVKNPEPLQVRDIITKFIPYISDYEVRNLSSRGFIKIGTFVNPGDILVGKLSPYESNFVVSPGRFKRDGNTYTGSPNNINRNVKIIDTPIYQVCRDTSLRVPDDIHGRVIDIKIKKKFRGPYSFGIKTKDTSVIATIIVYIAEISKIQLGDKLSGRHGNKGVISKIIPREDMPFLPDGTSVDIILNPLGVPSRMNIGQLFESTLGFAATMLNRRFKVTPFDETTNQSHTSTSFIEKKFKEAAETTKWVFSEQSAGQVMIRDGRDGQLFENPVTIGSAYILKLVHVVEKKIHARSVGPYSKITQQPVKGRSHNGGQRFGEMEVWALQAYGAAYTLQEILTFKSDDLHGRNELLWSIVNDKPLPQPGIPESFRLIVKELQALCLDLSAYKTDDPKEIDLMT